MDIFVSYSSVDRERVWPLVEALSSSGWDIWWDRTLLAGEIWERSIEEALDSARSVIVAWSHASIQSNWVRSEADEAQRRGVLLPVLLDDVRIPLAYRSIHAARLIGWDRNVDHSEFRQLSKALIRCLGNPPSPLQKKSEQEHVEASEDKTIADASLTGHGRSSLQKQRPRSDTARIPSPFLNSTSGTSHWLVNAGSPDQTHKFIADNFWQTEDTASSVSVLQMKPGDRIAMKTNSVTKHNLPFDTKGRKLSTLEVKAVGTVSANPGDGKRVIVQWDPVIRPRGLWYWYNYTRQVWRLKPQDALAQGLIAFVFEGKEQNYTFYGDQFVR